MIFILLVSVYLYLSKKKIQLNANVFTLVQLNWLYILPVIFSLYSFVFFPKTFNELGYFAKGFLILISFTLFLHCVALLITELNEYQRNIIINSFIYSIALSSLYGIIQIVLIVFYKIDIDQILSGILPFTDSEINFADSALGSFYRLNGFSFDPSVQGSFSIFVLILLIYKIFKEEKYVYIIPFNIIFLSFIMTMSGSAAAGLILALAILFIFNFTKIQSKNIVFGFLLLIPILAFYFSFEEEILFFAEHKFQSDGTTSTHAAIALNALSLGLDYPLTGIGFNNFSYAYQQFFFESNYNAHNSWLNFFVETGLVGFLFKLFYTILIIFLIHIKKSSFSIYFISGFIGLNFASLGYEVLNLFFSQLMIFILFILVMENFFGNTNQMKEIQ